MISPNGQAFEKDALGPRVTFRKRAWKLGHKADILATLSSPQKLVPQSCLGRPEK